MSKVVGMGKVYDRQAGGWGHGRQAGKYNTIRLDREGVT